MESMKPLDYGKVVKGNKPEQLANDRLLVQTPLLGSVWLGVRMGVVQIFGLPYYLQSSFQTK
jgi:hypothetical protein